MSEKVTMSGRDPEPGLENAPAPGAIDPATGQNKDYWILSADERAKGFVRPVRRSYRHVGEQPKHPLRPLDDEEKVRLAPYEYVAYEDYPDDPESSLTGRYWTQAQLDAKACGTKTTMPLPIAETWACDISFYGSTFCCNCGTHLPITEFVWEDGTRLGT